MYTIYKITSDHTVDFAAEELKKYLRMMMPRCGEIAIEYRPDAKDGFRLGLMQDFGLDTSEAEDVTLDDILHIDTDECGGIIAGSNVRSVLLAVYRYLTINGCRWLFPGIDGEYIPIKPIEPVKYHKMADCRYRGQCNEGAEGQHLMMEAIDFTPKIGLNVFMLEFDIPLSYYTRYYDHAGNEQREPEPVSSDTILQWKRQCEAEIAKRGLQFHDMGHGWTSMPFGLDMASGWINNEPIKVSDEIREMLALTKGSRGGTLRYTLTINFCMSNPKARAIVTKYIADYAQSAKHADYLHVWLADGYNNHCECDECCRKTPADWYVILLNEIDEELTKRGLRTRIVFICYVDTTWPPLIEKLKNPKRFSLLVAAISRNYAQSLDPKLDVAKVPTVPYVRNKNVLPKSVGEYIAYSRKWLEACPVPSLVYEYHFWLPQYRDLGLTSLAKIIYDDISGYRHHGFDGIIEDGSQRSFFPVGLAFHTYAAALYDSSIPFDNIVEDVLSHAYGDDWREVLDFYRELGEAVDFNYMFGNRWASGGKSLYYNPSIVPELERVKEITAKYAPMIEAHKNMPYRVQTVSYRILRRYLEYCVGIADALILKASGKDAEARESLAAFMREFGKYELEMEVCYDQNLAFRSIEKMIKDDTDPTV